MVRNMEFIKTLFPAFFVWQFLSLCPFTLTRISLQPIVSKLHNFITIASVAIQFGVLIFGFCDFKHYIHQSYASIIITISAIQSMVFVRCTSIAVISESWLKRSTQMEFLRQLDHIDAILHKKLLIDLNYDKQRRVNFRKFIGWIGLYLSFEVCSGILGIFIETNAYFVYMVFYAIPLFICVMRYHQFISFVNLLCDRFQAINEAVRNLSIEKCKESPKRLSKSSRGQARYQKRHRELEICMIINKLRHLRRVYHLIVESSHSLCRLFCWSMLFNIVNDFFNVLLNSYWVAFNILNPGSVGILLLVVMWTMFNIFMLVAVSNACQFACNEVKLDMNTMIFQI